MAALPKLVGSVDHLGRPVVRVAVVGRDDDVLATIDTGFNGELMLAAGDAAAIGVKLLEDAEEVELGDRSAIAIKLGKLRLRWLDTERDVTVFVSPRKDPTREGSPVMLIGTRLLAPHLLLIDFAANTVEIETQ